MSRPAFFALAVAVLLGVAVSPAVAQKACQHKVGGGAPSDAAACRDVQLPSPDANAPVRGVVPAGFVTADKGDSEVQIQAGKPLGDSRTWGQVSLNATATAPLSDAPLTPLAELRGVLPGTGLELSFTGIRWPTLPAGTDRAAVQWCRDQNIPIADCAHAIIERKYPGLLREYERVSGYRRPIVYQFSVSASYNEHKFVDETSLEEDSQRLVPFTLGGTFGGFVGATLMTINGRYERRFEDGDEIEICSPVGLGTAERCNTTQLGEPESASKTVITAQARRFFSAFAVNARVAYRLDDETWSVEVPVYFIPNSDGRLIGGIVPGWSSEERRFNVRLFVGQAFGLRAN